MAGFNPLLHPGLAERFPAAYISMGETAENVARRHQITRRRQEELAVESHRRAAAARAEGRLRDELVPVSVSGAAVAQRSEERRVGKECVSTCRFRGSPVRRKQPKY